MKGYSNAPDNTTLDALSKITGIHTTVISRNNKFLADIGLIQGGQKKSSTDLGKRLGRALEHSQERDIESCWKEAVQTNEKVSGLVTTVRIKNGMPEADFSSHVLYVSGQKKTSSNMTGARCVVDVLIAAGLLHEENGTLIVSGPETKTSLPNVDHDLVSPATRDGNVKRNEMSKRADSATESIDIGNQNSAPQIAINIQLHLPETENADVYEKLFRALRENLLTQKK